MCAKTLAQVLILVKINCILTQVFTYFKKKIQKIQKILYLGIRCRRLLLRRLIGENKLKTPLTTYMLANFIISLSENQENNAKKVKKISNFFA